MKKRDSLKLLGGLFLATASSRFALATQQPSKYLQKTKAEWQTLLPRDRYAVLFEEHTEAPGSSALNHEKRAGTFTCAGCNQPLFKSSQKFDSGTGWPSFFDVIPKAINTKTDYKIFVPRTEYHCSRCSGHQGHVFTDGPKPTGLRYCNNGLALIFVPEGQPLKDLLT